MRRFPSPSRPALLIAGSIGALLGLASPAAAHVDPNVPSAPAGSRTTVEFKIEHGCEGSPTLEVTMQMPDGAVDVVPVEEPGWTVVYADGVATWSGGSLPDDQEGTFGITLTVPQVAGQKLHFPTVQRCEVGEEAWIDTGAGESENPAPVLAVTDAVPGTAPPTTTPPATTGPTTTTSAPTTTTEATTTTAAGPERDDGPSDDDGDDGGGGALPVAIGGAAAVAAAVGGFVAVRRRQR